MKSHWLSAAARRVVLAVPALLLAAGAARAENEGGPGAWRPTDISLDGHRSDWLFDVTTVSVTILFVIMTAIIVWASLRHREGHKAHYEHGVGRSHLILTAVVSSVIFFGVDGTLLVNAYADIHEGFWNFPTEKQSPLLVEVMAQQWAWNIRYAGPDNKWNTADDIVTLNDMHIPIGRPVMIKLQSKDVIHSFYLPNFRTKQDAIPGSITKMWFQGTKPGVVEIGCAQHCGTNHYKMKGTLTVESDAEYQTWYAAAVADAQRRFYPEDTEAQWGWDWEAEGLGPTTSTELGAAAGAAGETAKHPEGK